MQGFTNAAPPSGGGLRIVASGTGSATFSEPVKILLVTLKTPDTGLFYVSSAVITPGMEAMRLYGYSKSSSYLYSVTLTLSSDGLTYTVEASSPTNVSYIALA